MADLPNDLRESLVSALDATPVERLSSSVRRLIDEYRSGQVAAAPILASHNDVAAYAAYRMPATYAATRAALRQLAQVSPGFEPRTHLDVGGSTGAAAWAATDVFASLTQITVLDQVEEALALGRRLVASASHPALRSASWRRWRFELGPDPDREAVLPAADLVTICYVLGELPPESRELIVERAAASGVTVVLVEPGTPAGFGRILAARATLIEQGLTVLAPCPHPRSCPLGGTADWCHFAARVNRSALHRRLKDARLGYEDEKFSFIAAGSPSTATCPPRPIDGRVLRHPQFRKGMVTLQVCEAAGGTARHLVSKRQGELYRGARDTEWGDTWPPLA